MDQSNVLLSLIEKQFIVLKEQGTNQKQEEGIHYSKLVEQLDKENNGLRRVIFEALLKHQLKLSDIPQNLRLNSLNNNVYFTVAAHRCASENRNMFYLTEVLSLMYEDCIYGVIHGLVTQGEFHELICNWLNYLDYDKIEFKGDDYFERYFQKQKERHRDFFEAFGL